MNGISVSVKKKGKGRQHSVTIDKSYLACQHHVAMVAGMACLQTDNFQALLGMMFVCLFFVCQSVQAGISISPVNYEAVLHVCIFYGPVFM